MRRHESEDIFGVQVAGGIPGLMAQCAELISNVVDCDFIDLNVGCPIDLVFRTVRPQTGDSPVRSKAFGSRRAC